MPRVKFSHGKNTNKNRKALRRARAERTARSAGTRKQNPRNRQRNRRMAYQTGVGMLPLPTNTAFVVQNNVRSTNVVHERGKEIIGSLTFLNAAPSRFVVNEFDLDPLYLEGTRLQALCKSFQKYRFRDGTKFILQCNAPTTTTGGYVAGYTENPDQNMSTGYRATTAISALTGSVAAPVWTTQEVHINVRDKQKWYNLDDDTIEIMNAIQGKMVVQQTGPVSTTSNIVVPVWLEWDIELTGPAVQVTNEAAVTTAVFPYGVITRSPAADTSPWHSAEVGCALVAGQGAVNSLLDNALYQLVPGFETETGESVNFVWRYPNGTGKFYLFAGTKDEAINGNFFNWQTIFGEQPDLPQDGAVAYYERSDSAPPLPGRSLPPEVTVDQLTTNLNRSLRLNAIALARESAVDTESRMIAARAARSALMRT